MSQNKLMNLRTLSVAGLLVVGLVGLGTFLRANDGKKDAPAVTVDPRPIQELAGLPAVVSYADQIARVQPAVVSVHSTKFVTVQGNPLFNDPFFRRFFGFPDQLPGQQQQPRRREETGLGSGVIVTPDGFILTNNHVVEGADELEVRLADDRTFRARVIGTDPQTDVAVIKIDAQNLPFATLGNSDNLRVGDIVFALGNPLGVGQTVTMGIVSALSRQINILNNGQTRGFEDFIQTDAAINRGNSGGALVDAAGRLIGINTAIISPNSGAGNIGIGFAIPINLAASIMNSLVVTGEVSRGFLGVSLQELTPDLIETYGLRERRGALVTDVVEGGPAAAAGLRREDVILQVNGRDVRSVQDLRLRIASILPGTEIELTIFRDREERRVRVKLARLNSSAVAGTAPGARLLAGVEVAPVNDRTRSQFEIPESVRAGLVVTGVAQDGRFARVFEPGMVILSINGVQTGSLAAAREAIRVGRNRFVIAVGDMVRIVPVLVEEADR
jgi:serine protease Do/serine protease DegQ